ncbi:MAG: hypothetical protein ACRDTT_25940, partial [Pseudonocardiaceae bacterium]
MPGHRQKRTFAWSRWAALAFGGATSVDRRIRTPGRDWRAPTPDDVEYASRAVQRGRLNVPKLSQVTVLVDTVS